SEFDTLPGTGQNGRLRKEDVLQYLSTRSQQTLQKPTTSTVQAPAPTPPVPTTLTAEQKVSISASAEDEIIEMDRMRRMIADHMVNSKHVAPHVTSFVEADVTNLVHWRNKHKDEFQQREKINL